MFESDVRISGDGWAGLTGGDNEESVGALEAAKKTMVMHAVHHQLSTVKVRND
jgi:hypothetical protein